MKRLALLIFTIFIALSVNGQKAKKISRDWTSISQKIDVEVDTIRKFKVIASVKVESEDESAWTGVWARVDNKPGEGRGFFDNMGDRRIKSNEWKSYVVTGNLDERSAELNFGGLIFNNGKFYYDKFEVFIEDENGEFQPVEIPNPSFETKIEDSYTIEGWSEGISAGETYRVKEFTVSSSEDSVDGNYSMLVEGKGIKPAGSAEESLPNMGTYISIIFILIFILPLLTYASSTDENQWSKLGKIGFRFSFIYFLLIILFQNNGAYPFFNYVIEYPAAWMQSLVLWVGDDLIGIPYKIATSPNGSGDTTYDYLVVFTIFIIASIGTVIWSVLDRKRNNYKKLYYWLTTGVRYYVGLMLISYGLVKVIQLQFPEPTFYRLTETYGESSPMGLAWTFLGFSEGYNLFMGIAEVLAGLLMFRRFMTFGAVITLMTTMNVMAVNFFFDVPVKILSTHLVLMTLFLLSRDLVKVMKYLVTSKPVEKLTIIVRPKLPKIINISMTVIKVAIIGYALGYGYYDALGSQESYGKDAPKPPLYGVYEISNYSINGEELTNYKDERLWMRMRIERAGSALVQTRNKMNVYYKVEVDTEGQKIKFISYAGEANNFEMNYTLKDKLFNFDYIHGTDTISGQSKQLGKEDYLLTNRGFHWVSERPFNR